MSIKRIQKGFTLIEVLVAVTVMAVGLVALARLHALGISASGSSFQRTQASFLAYEMADRMRANPSALTSYTGFSSTTASPGCGVASGTTTPTSCTAAQLAQLDYYQWIKELGEQLPSGTGVVCHDSGPSSSSMTCDGGGDADVYTIKVSWIDDRHAATTAAQTKIFVTTFRP